MINGKSRGKAISRGLSQRQLRGLGVVAQGNRIRRVSDRIFFVKVPALGTEYKVSWTKRGWLCGCPEYATKRRACEHIYGVLFMIDLPNIVLANSQALERTCPKCGSNDIIRHGHRLNKGGPIQMLTCKACEYTFPVSHIRGVRAKNSGLALIALDLHFKGVSYSEISNHLWQVYGVQKPAPTIFYWVKRFEVLVANAAKNIKLSVGDKWLADEMVVRVRGRKMYLWDLMDFKTRVQIMTLLTERRDTKMAYELIRRAIKRAGKSPKVLMTDKLGSYSSAVNRMPELGIKHINKIRITAPENTIRLERLHSTIRRWERPGRGLKNTKTDSYEGFSNYYNFVRPHGSLGGRSPGNGLRNSRWVSLLNGKQGNQSRRRRKQK